MNLDYDCILGRIFVTVFFTVSVVLCTMIFYSMLIVAPTWLYTHDRCLARGYDGAQVTVLLSRYCTTGRHGRVPFERTGS